MPNRLRHFLGKPTYVSNVPIHSPTINEISEIGEVVYNIYITLATFNKESILKYLIGFSDEQYELVSHEDDYEVLTSIPPVVNETLDALSFFIKKEVKYDVLSSSFVVDGEAFISKENYKELSSVIKTLNGIAEEEDQSLKFKNNKAKQLYMKLMEYRAKYKKNKESDSLSLKDMLSILCNADGNGINVFNVGQLTIYQVYEHFERLSIKEQHLRLLRVWANGYLSDNEKLPEWIVRSKL